MLQIEGVRKVYKTGSMVQEALKGVSLSLRDNEFVAILGPSGSGKTTLLNIIGGLDRYDEGDLIINGVSTKKYSDRDWDSYRNHTVGFVFQSYNLIPHQTVLKNVELALTISGISSGERSRRAVEVLEKVGLGEHIHKLPSQLSGGQMQRVAIARALVNDPDILLADEPTGALDSDTSIHVMDLLKEVAGDRLVVMVTHNPELAEKYATRIVTLMDGTITSDSDPYTPDQGESVHRNMGRASMSFLTALSLSFNNLKTKKARTILVSFAGSIGIIGIALILSLSHGANQYIHNMEEESLQSYPLTISDTNIDVTNMYSDSLGGVQKEEDTPADTSKDVTESRLISGLLSGIKNNDLKSLRSYFESDDCDIYDYVQSLEYSYRITPQIFKKFDNGYRQVNPDTGINALGFSNDESLLTGMVSSFSTTTTFNPLPTDESIYREGYELKIGEWPQKYDECVVVLTRSGHIADMILYNLGLKDPTELDDLIKAYGEGKTLETDETPTSYDYEDFMGIEFKLLPASAFYSYDKEYKVWTDRSGDREYMEKLLDNAETIRIVGVVQPKEDNMSPILYQGISYHASITEHLIELSKDTDIVRDQLEHPDVDVFTGKPFGEKDDSAKDLDFSSFFNVDKKAVDKAFDLDVSDFDMSSLDLSGIDLSDMDLSSMDLSDTDLSQSFSSLSEDDIKELFEAIDFNITADSMESLFKSLLEGYTAYAKNQPQGSIEALPDAIRQYIASSDARQILISDLQEIMSDHFDTLLSAARISGLIGSVMQGYPEYLSENNLSETVSYDHLADYLQSDKAKKLIEDGVQSIRDELEEKIDLTADAERIAGDLLSGYTAYAEKNSLPTFATLLESFSKYLETDEAKELIGNLISDAVDTSALEEIMSSYTEQMSEQITALITQLLSSVTEQITAALETGMTSLMSGLSDNLMSAFNFDIDSLSKMIQFNMSAQELQELMASLLSTNESNLDSNLRKMGYADIDKPAGITIYPADYESKNHIKQIISDYNSRMIAAGEDDKVIEYTDLVDALTGSITTIIDVISYILIAFVAVSLVVSSIMIGVITYISVLERRKEIGILRAIGASKHNISSVFNAETFIIGALAGMLGVGITELLIIPINMIIHALSGQNNINAILPPVAAIVLIALSIVLTLIGGIIPSRKASKSDPVTALRSE